MPVKRLTALFVQKARAIDCERIEDADEVTRGLHLRLGGNGHKSWSAVFRIGGRKGRMTLTRRSCSRTPTRRPCP
jgi:hypothetical protein